MRQTETKDKPTGREKRTKAAIATFDIVLSLNSAKEDGAENKKLLERFTFLVSHDCIADMPLSWGGNDEECSYLNVVTGIAIGLAQQLYQDQDLRQAIKEFQDKFDELS